MTNIKGCIIKEGHRAKAPLKVRPFLDSDTCMAGGVSMVCLGLVSAGGLEGCWVAEIVPNSSKWVDFKFF